MSDMSVEDQKFIALEGIHTWIVGVTAAGDTLNSQLPRNAEPDGINAWRRTFQVNRHWFLIAANKLVEYIEWAKKLDYLDPSMFAEIDALADEIKKTRDMNEHVIDYFVGKGRKPADWVVVESHGTSDASSTIGSMIGGRVDHKEVVLAARKLSDRLPAAYWPK